MCEIGTHAHTSAQSTPLVHLCTCMIRHVTVAVSCVASGRGRVDKGVHQPLVIWVIVKHKGKAASIVGIQNNVRSTLHPGAVRIQG